VPIEPASVRRESDQLVATVTFTPHPFNEVVVVLSAVLLAILLGYILAENLGHT